MTSSQHYYEYLKYQYELGIDEVIEPYPTNKRLFSKQQAVIMEGKMAASYISDRKEKINVGNVKNEEALFPSSESTRSLALQANTLTELRALVENFNDCSLKKTAMNTVFSDGNPKARIMVIGEAPGADEDRQGLPFVGLSGKLLDKMFATIGLDRTKIYITNIMPWRPPGNRQPTLQETNLCLPFVERHIELIAPDFLILVGGTSAKTLLHTTEGIMKLRGKWLSFQTANMSNPIRTLATFHPAYLLRAPGQKRLAWLDLLALKQAINIS